MMGFDIEMGALTTTPNEKLPRPNQATDRLADVDRTKGFAIVLVVWGHIASFAPAGSPLLFYISIEFIYNFHMPLFMYLSGFVYFYSGLHERFWQAPFAQIAKRFDRLMVPFIFFGALVIVGKYFAGHFVALPDPVTSIERGIWDVASDSSDNPSSSIWYLLVVFVYGVLTPIIWRVGQRKFYLLFAVGVLGWIFMPPPIFYLSRIAKYFLFFAIGGFVAAKAEIVLPVVKKYAFYFMLFFVSISVIFFSDPYALLICGLASLPAFHGLLRQRIFYHDRVLNTFGRNSMVIYLLNTIFIGVVGILLVAMGVRSWTLLIILFAVGLAGPMVVGLIVSRARLLRPFARYLS